MPSGCVESTMRTAYEKGFNVISRADPCLAGIRLQLLGLAHMDMDMEMDMEMDMDMDMDMDMEMDMEMDMPCPWAWAHHTLSTSAPIRAIVRTAPPYYAG